jgi:hypothetical protein
MSDSQLSVEATRDAITATKPTEHEKVSPPPVLISEHQVMLGTAAAVRPRSTITRRMIDALRVVGDALRPPPPRPSYARRSYLESARMSREMDRL